MPVSNVAIIGYGTAGQALAVLLGRAGVDVQVFEQAPEPGPVGAGFLLQPSGLQVLWRMGLLDQALRHGAIVSRLFGQSASGKTVMDIRYEQLDRRLYGLGMQRGALFELLDAAWQPRGQLHAGTRVVEVTPDLRHVRDQQGRHYGPFDLIVAADGANSCLRSMPAPVRRDRAYPWGARWCLLDAARWEHGDQLRQRYSGTHKMAGLLPVGTRPGDPHAKLSFFWSLRSDAQQAWEQQALSHWKQELAQLWPECAGQLQEISSHGQLLRANYRDAVVRAWSRGRLVLAGDAAHAMSPQLGQGVNMALLDAWTLAEQLLHTHDVDQALANYQRIRRSHVRIYQFWSRWLTPLFQSDLDSLAVMRDLLLGPLGHLPPGKGHLLRVLSGTQSGVLGKLALADEFVQILQQHRDRVGPE